MGVVQALEHRWTHAHGNDNPVTFHDEPIQHGQLVVKHQNG